MHPQFIGQGSSGSVPSSWWVPSSALDAKPRSWGEVLHGRNLVDRLSWSGQPFLLQNEKGRMTHPMFGDARHLLIGDYDLNPPTAHQLRLGRRPKNPLEETWQGC